MNAKKRILVWDAPTRVFHWALALSFAGAFLTAESERLRHVHVVLGYTVLGLIAFRLIWGFVGSRYALFRSFAFGPREVIGYLKSLITLTPRRYIGHNPAGSIAIYAILSLGLATGVTGYASYNHLGGDWLEVLHEGLANAMLAVVIVHVVGVLLSSVLHRENLIGAMLSGYKEGDPTQGLRRARWFVAALLVTAVAVLWTGVVQVPEAGAGKQATVEAERSEPARGP